MIWRNKSVREDFMTESNELTGIERELVLQYLRDDNVPVTVTLEDKPEKIETDFADEKTRLPEKSERIPLSAVFPVAIKAEQMNVLNEGIILLKDNAKIADTFLNKPVRVQFYFNRLGLYFNTTMKAYSKGLALVVPKSIKRIKDSEYKKEYDLSAVISFTSEDRQKIGINCVSSEKYNLFTQPKWGDIDLDKQHKAKSYLEKFVAEAKTGAGLPIGNGVHLFPVCRFLTDKNAVNPQTVEGRSSPLEIIYFDDKKAVLASRNSEDELSLEAEYFLNLAFTLEKNKFLKRNVNVECSVVNKYVSDEEGNVHCYVCSFKNVKEEDIRFLYERATGKRLNE